MTFQKTFKFATISSCLLIGAAFASQASSTNTDYTITLLKGCDVVAKYAMNTEQVEAYQALQAEEQKMHALEQPIQAIEQQLQEYTEQIEELTSLAIQDNDDTLYIDKSYLKQQEQVVAKLDKLMDEHQHDFDALGEQGSLIGAKAEDFTDTIDASFDNVDYDQMRIDYPDNVDSNYQCHSDIRNI
ncbi:hypothetical protein RI844_19245 [Thalassotalea fonticola]|uniref:OmpH family outer membrane protein n=1 Tax=Thalassotalea fonticola TaxID=3065649 RepID=A0ABZ0GP23_9GAMM|nr:hypothetical protein RI844_19245 [Colwelliaceae bacterium S1-1]